MGSLPPTAPHKPFTSSSCCCSVTNLCFIQPCILHDVLCIEVKQGDNIQLRYTPFPILNQLQTGMRSAFGKPQGTVARVHTGQVIMSIRTKLQNKEHIHISKKWGFTKFNVGEFENMVAEKRLIPDGCGVKYIPNRGPLDKWRALHS
ncbi:hypothetical protein FD755_014475 [Muntiacus reevesi]|uniref:Ribosomal protein L10e/L16 domain-containing protein n=1 Tax=Muntiacus reevesi TaxID=9886 RepID=A0A5N3XJB3_MUNRE|nr:hypothetical protein FD755_014475 [Muntiacus reevesi]